MSAAPGRPPAGNALGGAPQQGSPLRRAIQVLRRGMDRAGTYMPIILTAALALGTYWLVRVAPKFAAPGEPVAAVHEPDFFMRGFVVKSYLPSGALRSELSGKEGRHYPDTDTLEVDHARLRSVSPEGLVTHATADRGISNSDATEVQLFGNAIVVRDAATAPDGRPLPRLEFRGDFLHVFTDIERVRSNKPVTLTRGTDQFTADSLDYDNGSGVANLNGRVRGVLQPAQRGAAR